MNENKLMKTIGYEFKNVSLLRTALTHSSVEGRENYERLEFLGDAVLELVVSDFLFRRLPDESEGQLTQMRARLVCEKSLSAYARKIGLGSHLILGNSEEHSGGREKNSILCDVTEAVIGAMYLDGGWEPAKHFVMGIVGELFRSGQAEQAVDSKSELQIELQKHGNVDLRYEEIKTEGPPHDRTFFVRAVLDGRTIGEGSGKSKKHAEQAAAAEALKNLRKQ